jgi:hypothetical protein
MYGAAEMADGGREDIIGVVVVTVPLELPGLTLLLLLLVLPPLPPVCCTVVAECLCARGLGFDCRV